MSKLTSRRARVTVSLVLAAYSPEVYGQINLTLGLAPTQNVTIATNAFTAAALGAYLNVGDVQAAQPVSSLLSVVASGSLLFDGTGAYSLSPTTAATKNTTLFSIGGSVNGSGVDLILTNAASAVFPQSLQIAAGAVTLDSVDAHLAPGAGVTASSSAGAVAISATSISIPNGVNTSVDPSFTASHSGGQISLTTTVGDIVVGNLSSQTPVGPGGLVTLNSAGGISAGAIDTAYLYSGLTAGWVHLTAAGNILVSSVSAGAITSGTSPGVSIVATGTITIPGAISTTQSTPATQGFNASTPSVTLVATGAISTGSISTASIGTGVNSGSICVSTAGSFTAGALNASSLGSAGAGLITVTATGSINLASLSAAGSTGSLGTATPGIILASTSGSVSITGTTNAPAASAPMISIAGSGVYTGALTATPGTNSIVVTSYGPASLGSISTATSQAAVSVTATGLLTLAGVSEIANPSAQGLTNASGLSLLGGSAGITVNGSINVASTNTNAPAGVFVIKSSGPISISGDLLATAAGSALSGSATTDTIQSTSGPLFIGGGIYQTSSQGGSRPLLLSGSSVDVVGPMVLTGVGSAHGVTLTVSSAGPVTFGGRVDLSATGVASGSVTVTAGGDISFSTIAFTGNTGLPAGPTSVLTTPATIHLGSISGGNGGVTLSAGEIALTTNSYISASTVSVKGYASRPIRLVSSSVTDPSSLLLTPAFFGTLSSGNGGLSIGDGISPLTVETAISLPGTSGFLEELTTSGSLTVPAGKVITYNGLSGIGSQTNGTASLNSPIAPGLPGQVGDLSFTNVIATLSSSNPPTQGLTVVLSPLASEGLDGLAFTGGSLTLSNEPLLVSAFSVVDPGQVYPIVTLNGTSLTGTFVNLPNGATAATIGGVPLIINYTPSAITLTAIPEPHLWATLPALALAVRPSRRKRPRERTTPPKA